MKRILFMGLVLFALITPALAEAPSVSAARAVLVDAGSERVLFEKQADEKSLIASTTKIMTALVALERRAPGELVTVAEAAGTEGSSIYLKRGERVSVETLLYGLLLESGNDAARALAIHCAGSEEKFAELMNEKAAALGMNDTHFSNASGLDGEEHYSTARDMARLMCAAMEDPLFAEMTSSKSKSIGSRYFVNHNKLLSLCEGADGGKTGYTKAAGRTLVSTAVRNGHRLVCVTLNAPDDWNDHQKLYDFASCYEWISVGGEYETPIVSGVFPSVAAVPESELFFPVLPGETVSTEIFLPRFAYAPLNNREALGLAVLKIDGEAVSRVRLVSKTACPERRIKW